MKTMIDVPLPDSLRDAKEVHFRGLTSDRFVLCQCVFESNHPEFKTVLFLFSIEDQSSIEIHPPRPVGATGLLQMEGSITPGPTVVAICDWSTSDSFFRRGIVHDVQNDVASMFELPTISDGVDDNGNLFKRPLVVARMRRSHSGIIYCSGRFYEGTNGVQPERLFKLENDRFIENSYFAESVIKIAKLEELVVDEFEQYGWQNESFYGNLNKDNFPVYVYHLDSGSNTTPVFTKWLLTDMSISSAYAPNVFALEKHENFNTPKHKARSFLQRDGSVTEFGKDVHSDQSLSITWLLSNGFGLAIAYNIRGSARPSCFWFDAAANFYDVTPFIKSKIGDADEWFQIRLQTLNLQGDVVGTVSYRLNGVDKYHGVLLTGLFD